MQKNVTKMRFMIELQDIINEIPSRDVKLLIGDLNAQIGADRQGLGPVIGPHGTATQINDNGDRLLSFCNIKWPMHRKHIFRPQNHSQENMEIA